MKVLGVRGSCVNLMMSFLLIIQEVQRLKVYVLINHKWAALRVSVLILLSILEVRTQVVVVDS